MPHFYEHCSHRGGRQHYRLSFDLNGLGTDLPLINAFQVRNISSAAVPEPGQVAALLLLLCGLGGYVWLMRRTGTPAIIQP